MDGKADHSVTLKTSCKLVMVWETSLTAFSDAGDVSMPRVKVDVQSRDITLLDPLPRSIVIQLGSECVPQYDRYTVPL